MTEFAPVYPSYIERLKENHILIAGATGSGKSVILNNLIYTIVADTNDRFILIDPKRVEFSIWKSCDQCIRHATTYPETVQAFELALDLIDIRYKYMEKAGLRKFDGDNIYIFVDELAELFAHGKMFRDYIQSIAQIGRAAKVHLIVATQSPTRDVIPSKIKINFDCIIGLRVNSRQDSYNVIRKSGLENLPKYGECIVLNSNGYKHWTDIPMYTDKEMQKAADARTASKRPKPKKESFFKRLFTR